MQAYGYTRDCMSSSDEAMVSSTAVQVWARQGKATRSVASAHADPNGQVRICSMQARGTARSAAKAQLICRCQRARTPTPPSLASTNSQLLMLMLLCQQAAGGQHLHARKTLKLHVHASVMFVWSGHRQCQAVWPSVSLQRATAVLDLHSCHPAHHMCCAQAPRADRETQVQPARQPPQRLQQQQQQQPGSQQQQRAGMAIDLSSTASASRTPAHIGLAQPGWRDPAAHPAKLLSVRMSARTFRRTAAASHRKLTAMQALDPSQHDAAIKWAEDWRAAYLLAGSVTGSTSPSQACVRRAEHLLAELQELGFEGRAAAVGAACEALHVIEPSGLLESVFQVWHGQG